MLCVKCFFSLALFWCAVVVGVLVVFRHSVVSVSHKEIAHDQWRDICLHFSSTFNKMPVPFPIPPPSLLGKVLFTLSTSTTIDPNSSLGSFPSSMVFVPSLLWPMCFCFVWYSVRISFRLISLAIAYYRILRNLITSSIEPLFLLFDWKYIPNNGHRKKQKKQQSSLYHNE